MHDNSNNKQQMGASHLMSKEVDKSSRMSTETKYNP